MPSHKTPLKTNRLFTGFVTQRNPLRDAGSRVEEKFYGGRSDAFIDGQNAEISSRLTAVRRAGHTEQNNQTFSDVGSFYEFRMFNARSESIRVMVDEDDALFDTTGIDATPNYKAEVWSKSPGAGQTFAQSVGNTLYFTNGVDQKKWVQTLVKWVASTVMSPFMTTFIIDGNGNIQQLISCIVPVSLVEISSDVLTITAPHSLVGIVSIGLEVKFSGLTAATYLNGETVTITAVSGSTFTADFNHADDSQSEAGIGTVLQGGHAKTGGTEPTWNTNVLSPLSPSTDCTTADGNALWMNRGQATPTQWNWGIVAPESQPAPTLAGDNGSWQANTFYSADGVILDSNGNLQAITTPGKSGSSAPSWSTSLTTSGGTDTGGTTNDGSVQWTLIQKASTNVGNCPKLAWQAHYAYPFTHTVNGADYPVYVKATAAGTPCLFRLQRGPGITFAALAGHAGNPVTVGYDYTGGDPHTHTIFSGYQYSYPHTPGSTDYVNSLMINPQHDDTSIDAPDPIPFATLNGAGEVTGSTSPFSSFSGGDACDWTMSMYGTFHVPGPQLSFTLKVHHDDGFIFGIDGGVSSTNGSATPLGDSIDDAAFGNGYGQTRTAVKGYPVLGVNNNNGNWIVTYNIKFPAAGDYNFEFDFSNWHSVYTFSVTLGDGGGNIVPEESLESAAVAPVWPAWTPTPTPPSVYDASQDKNANYVKPSCTAFQWVNIGPANDYTWQPKTRFVLAGGIVDSNFNNQFPLRAGVSGALPPKWASTVNALTNDAPNLIWIEEGVAPAAPVGTISTYNQPGWRYCMALVNSLTKTVSNAGPLTAGTGTFVGANGIQFAPGEGLPDPTVIDPQADYVAIFRTTDGELPPFLIPGLDNAAYTVPLAEYLLNGYLDTNQDADLNNLISAPLALQNTPPPAGLVNLTFHLNRVWGSVGNTVYWSVGPDTPIGNGQEGFPPANSDVMPSVVKRIVPTAIGAFVWTVSDIYFVQGAGTPTSPILPAVPYMEGVGLLSYNALTVGGSIQYAMTSDRQVVALDPSSGVSQVGGPIGDQFKKSNWDPAAAYLSFHVDGTEDHALYVADGTTGYFRMMPSPAPETGSVVWSTFFSVVGGCKAVQSIEVSPGVHRLLVGPLGSGPILKRDLAVFTDNGTPYPYDFTVGSINLAPPGQVAEVIFITTECVARGSKPTLGVLLDEALPYYTGPFDQLTYSTNDPPNLPPSKSLYNQRFYMSQSEEAAVCRNIQIKFSWPAEDSQNELLSLTLFGGLNQEE